MVSAGLLGCMVLLVMVVVLGGSEAMAQRLNVVQGFAGTLVAALVTVITGYGLSAHFDDKDHLDRHAQAPLRPSGRRQPRRAPTPPRRPRKRPPDALGGAKPTPIDDDPLRAVINEVTTGAHKSYVKQPNR